MKFTGERYIPNSLSDPELEIEHLHRYYSVLDLVKGKVTVDAATGEGYGAALLADYADHVYGIDISVEAITHAKEKYIKDNLEFREASIDSLPLPNNSVDVVISFETIEHVDEDLQRSFMQEVKRVLKEDGFLVISTPDKHVYSDLPDYKNEFHVKEFYKQEFIDFLSTYFEKVVLSYQRFQVNSVIRSDGSKNLRVFQYPNGHKEYGKYLLAICSEGDIVSANIDSLILEHNDKYQTLCHRIIELQDEVEERNQHIKNLDNLLDRKNEVIGNLGSGVMNWCKQFDSQLNVLSGQVERVVGDEYKNMEKRLQEIQTEYDDLVDKYDSLKEELRDKDNQIIALEARIEELNSFIDKITKVNDLIKEKKSAQRAIMEKEKELEKKEVVITDQQKEIQNLAQREDKSNAFNESLHEKDELIRNQQGHIESLLEKERALNNILDSDGWKLLKKYYSLRDRLLPQNSKRNLLFKLAFKFVKNPRQILTNINKDNARKFFYYIKTETPGSVENRIENVLSRNVDSAVPEMKTYDMGRQSKEKIVFSKVEKPLVSIVIPVYNQWNYTYSCLQSILENNEWIEYEVIIADDVSTDDTVNILDYVENIKLSRNEENLGFLRNCNKAAKLAAGKYIVFLNNDTNVQKDWLKHLVELMENDSSIGLAGSKLVYPDGRLQEAGGIIWNDASGWNYGRLDDPEKPEYNYVKEVDYISGASIMVRTDLWEAIGGFDERYVPAYFEDTDLAFEARRHGYKVVYQPKSVVVHFEGVSHGTDTNSGMKSYQVVNKNRFYKKWQDVLHKYHFENGKNLYWARDRSQSKKTILVIDHYVPQHDKDAGSKCTYHYLQLFLEMGLKVIFLGDNFYKHEPYTSNLQKIGVEVLYGNWYAKNIDAWIRNHGNYIDYVYLNRPHISIKYIDMIRKYTNATVIYFGHDLHYLREQRNYDVERNPELLKSANRWKKIESNLIEKSDAVYTVSTYEEKLIHKEYPNKTVRTIPIYFFDEAIVDIEPFESRSDLLFVGGFNHRPNYDAVMWFAKKIFPVILKSLPDVKFYVVGSNPSDEVKELASSNIVVTGYVTEEELESIYAKTRVVVVPLRFGAGVKGKVIEAMRFGVPVVTTMIGAEGLENIENHILIGKDEDELVQKVIELYTNKEIWNKLSQIQRRYVSQYFSTDRAKEIINKDINVF